MLQNSKKTNRSQRRGRTAFLRLIGILVSISMLLAAQGSPAAIGAQETDPFYIRSLQTGKKHFSEQNFRDAVKHLEIAAFGLSREKNLRAEAYIYLSLAHLRLDSMDAVERTLRTLLGFMPVEELDSLSLDDTVEQDLIRLLAAVSGESGETSPGPSARPSPTDARIRKAEIRRLKTDIKSGEADSAVYYRLHDLYAAEGNSRGAVKTLRQLLAREPEEFQALFLLGRTLYGQREFREAEIILQRLLLTTESGGLSEKLLQEAKALLILSPHHMGNANKTAMYAANWGQELISDIDTLALSESDRTLLRSILLNRLPD